MIANFITRALKSKTLYYMLQKRAIRMKNMINAKEDHQFINSYSKSSMHFLLQVNLTNYAISYCFLLNKFNLHLNIWVTQAYSVDISFRLPV